MEFNYSDSNGVKKDSKQVASVAPFVNNSLQTAGPSHPNNICNTTDTNSMSQQQQTSSYDAGSHNTSDSNWTPVSNMSTYVSTMDYHESSNGPFVQYPTAMGTACGVPSYLPHSNVNSSLAPSCNVPLNLPCRGQSFFPCETTSALTFPNYYPCYNALPSTSAAFVPVPMVNIMLPLNPNSQLSDSLFSNCLVPYSMMNSGNRALPFISSQYPIRTNYAPNKNFYRNATNFQSSMDAHNVGPATTAPVVSSQNNSYCDNASGGVGPVINEEHNQNGGQNDLHIPTLSSNNCITSSELSISCEESIISEVGDQGNCVQTSKYNGTPSPQETFGTFCEKKTTQTQEDSIAMNVNSKLSLENGDKELAPETACGPSNKRSDDYPNDPFKNYRLEETIYDEAKGDDQSETNKKIFYDASESFYSETSSGCSVRYTETFESLDVNVEETFSGLPSSDSSFLEENYDSGNEIIKFPVDFEHKKDAKESKVIELPHSSEQNSLLTRNCVSQGPTENVSQHFIIEEKQSEGVLLNNDSSYSNDYTVSKRFSSLDQSDEPFLNHSADQDCQDISVSGKEGNSSSFSSLFGKISSSGNISCMSKETSQVISGDGCSQESSLKNGMLISQNLSAKKMNTGADGGNVLSFRELSAMVASASSSHSNSNSAAKTLSSVIDPSSSFKNGKRPHHELTRPSSTKNLFGKTLTMKPKMLNSTIPLYADDALELSAAEAGHAANSDEPPLSYFKKSGLFTCINCSFVSVRESSIAEHKCSRGKQMFKSVSKVTDTPVKRKRGRPRKVSRPDDSPDPTAFSLIGEASASVDAGRDGDPNNSFIAEVKQEPDIDEKMDQFSCLDFFPLERKSKLKAQKNISAILNEPENKKLRKAQNSTNISAHSMAVNGIVPHPILSGETAQHFLELEETPVHVKIYSCKICPFKSTKQQSLASHMKVHATRGEHVSIKKSYNHRRIKRSNKKLTFADLQESSFRRRKLCKTQKKGVVVSRRESTVNSSEDPPIVIKQEYAANEGESSDEFERNAAAEDSNNIIYTCRSCHIIFRSFDKFELHVGTHNKNTADLRCPSCNFVTFKEDHLKSHLLSHGVNSYVG